MCSRRFYPTKKYTFLWKAPEMQYLARMITEWQSLIIIVKLGCKILTPLNILIIEVLKHIISKFNVQLALKSSVQISFLSGFKRGAKAKKCRINPDILFRMVVKDLLQACHFRAAVSFLITIYWTVLDPSTPSTFKLSKNYMRARDGAVHAKCNKNGSFIRVETDSEAENLQKPKIWIIPAVLVS